MNASKVSRLLFAFVAGIVLCCCSGKPAKKEILGHWKAANEQAFYDFAADGTVTGEDLGQGKFAGTYTLLDEGTVVLTVALGNDPPVVKKFNFRFRDGDLCMKAATPADSIEEFYKHQ